MGKETGGPAFPFTCKSDPDFYGRTTNIIKAGMTLRDYFAGQALAGMLNSKALAHLSERGQADIAYKYADAMMEARK